MKKAVNPFINLHAGEVSELADCERFAEAGHLWSQPEIDALILAFAVKRPLLVRGEAGSGKSQIARAAAKTLKSDPLLVEVIHPRFEALDLLYQFDAIKRLSDAQIEHKLDETNLSYVKRGQLWEAFERGKEVYVPVLLLDEIDKADADLPNALLEVLGNRSFPVPHLDNKIVTATYGQMPLVIITTNEERELPAAFVRRCIVLNLNPPKEDDAFVDWLKQRGFAHPKLKSSAIDDVCGYAARQVLADRKKAASLGYPKVGLAEYIDLLIALDELTVSSSPADRAIEQYDWLKRLSRYALVKNADQDQNRGAVPSPQDKEGLAP